MEVCWTDSPECWAEENEKREAAEEECAFNKLSSLAKTIVNAPCNSRGHKGIETCDKPDMVQLVSLIDELNSYYSTLDYARSVFCTLEADGSGSLELRETGLAEEKNLLLFQFGCTSGEWIYFSGENCNG